MNSKIESLEQSAHLADTESRPFMEPEPPKQKGKPGRRPDTPEEKQRKAQEKAQQQKARATQPQTQKTILMGDSAQTTPQAQTQTNQGPTGKQICKNFMPAVSALAVQWVGDPRAQMTPGEIDACAEGLGMMMDKYMPTVMNQYQAEATLLVAFGGYGLRLYKMKREVELNKYHQTAQTQPLPPKPENSYVAQAPETNQ